MLFVTLMLFTSLVVVFLLKVVSFLISESVTLNREELSSYECGFEHHNLSRIPFSLRYFFLTLVFLLFDLEVILMLFLPYFSFSTSILLGLLVLLLMLIVLYAGLLYEWQDGTLDWLS